MSLMRWGWDPFREFSGVRDVMDRLFEESFLPVRALEMPTTMTFPVDIKEREDAYEVKASLPGIKPEDVDITVSGNMLTIRGERKEEREEKEEGYLIRERRYGTCMRSITLPTSADADRAEARFENGVLTLTVPKAPEAKPKHIQVSARQSLGAGEKPGQPQQQGKGS